MPASWSSPSRQFIQEHKDEITALQILFSRPYAQRHLDFAQVRELAEQLNEHLHQADPLFLTEALWQAYTQLEKDRVRGAGRAAHPGGPGLAGAPCRPGRGPGALPGAGADGATRSGWQAQAAAGRPFTPQQRWWLDEIARHIGINVSISAGGSELFRLPEPRRAGGGAKAVWE